MGPRPHELWPRWDGRTLAAPRCAHPLHYGAAEAIDAAPDEPGNSSDLVEPQGSDYVVYLIPGHPDYSEAVGALVAAGAQVDARARDGRTPLHVAAAQRGEDTVGVLLDAGADGAARAVDGKTPFDNLADGLRGTDAYRRLRHALTP